MNRNRTTDHAIRELVELHLRALSGGSNGVDWSTSRVANDRGHQAGARDFPVQKPSHSTAPADRLVRYGRGKFRWQTSGAQRSVDHEAHEEHEGIRERSVRCHPLVPARGDNEPQSYNRSCDSRVCGTPPSCPSCPSWSLQRSRRVNVPIGSLDGVRRAGPAVAFGSAVNDGGGRFATTAAVGLRRRRREVCADSMALGWPSITRQELNAVSSREKRRDVTAV